MPKSEDFIRSISSEMLGAVVCLKLKSSTAFCLDNICPGIRY